MVPFKTLCCLVLFGLIFATWSSQAEEINEAELAAAQFEEVDIIYDSAEDETQTRAIFGKKKDRCSCTTKNSCGCCAKPRILGYKLSGCLNVTMYSEDKKLQVALHVQNQQVAQYNFSTAAIDQLCSTLPKPLGFLKFCLHTKTSETEEQGLTSCTSLDIIYKETTFAIINFSCIRFKDGNLDFDQYQEIDRKTVLKVKIRNPISGIKKLIENLLAKKEE